MVTVGTPCLSSQLASRPPFENRYVGFEAERFDRLGVRRWTTLAVLRQAERWIGRATCSNFTSAVVAAHVLHLGLGLREGVADTPG